MRRAAPIAALAGLLAGCGSIGDPLPPSANLARPIEDLEARQVGEEIQVAWTWPRTTTEGMIARRIGGFTLWAVDVPSLEDELATETIDHYRREVLTIGEDELDGFAPGDRLDVRVPLGKLELGQEAFLVVTAANRAGRDAGYSNQVPVQPLEPPEQAVWEFVLVEPAGVGLAWLPTAHAEEYSIVRASGEDGEFAPLGRLAATSFLDRSVVWEEAYRYRIRPLRESAAGWIEGGVSDTASVTPRDSFPPAPPRGLRAVRIAATVELSWLASPETDLAGYRIYRDGEAISETAADTTYSDGTAGDDERSYSVSAFDTRGNESEPCAAIAVPAAAPSID